jgi:hypothetical protein
MPTMGNAVQQGLRSLSSLELRRIMRALEICLPEDAEVEGFHWHSRDGRSENYRVRAHCVTTASAAVYSTWIAERSGSVYRLLGRPATLAEVDFLLQAIRELGDVKEMALPLAEAHYDCVRHAYQLLPTLFEQMHEGETYRRWLLRRYEDGRPLSVGYVCETRRGNALAVLPARAVLRGDPWSG